MLKDIGMYSGILPLHSNIPYSDSIVPLEPDSYSWIFLFFGSLDSKWKPEPFFSLVDQARIMANINTCRFISLGNIDIDSTNVWNSISCTNFRGLYPAFVFQKLGVRSAEEVSHWLQKASFGISMAPLLWIGKSGSVAAMIEHGLPVIVPSYQISSIDSFQDILLSKDQFLFIDSSLPSKLCSARRKSPKDISMNTGQTLVNSFLQI